MYLIAGLADHLGDPGLLEQHGDEDARGHVAADGHDAAVIVADAQAVEHLLVPGIGHHGVGHAVGDALHQLLVQIDGQHLAAGGHQLLGNGPAKSAQSDHGVRFHKLTYPIISFVSA